MPNLQGTWDVGASYEEKSLVRLIPRDQVLWMSAPMPRKHVVAPNPKVLLRRKRWHLTVLRTEGA